MPLNSPDQTPDPTPNQTGPGALIRRMGPAWIISAVACGPATLASVSMAGAVYGYRLLWVVVLSALLAFVAQYMAARLGILTGQGVISTVERHLGKTMAWILMFDALICTWLASTVLMKALVGVTMGITGLNTPWWSLLYGGGIFILVGIGGYKALEIFSKLLVSLVVLCFVITVAIAKPDFGAIFSGLIPSFPGGLDSALMMAGIMGGAVHITILAMHTYNVNSRGWTTSHMGLARWDTFLSMFVAFGLYSCAIFLAAAVVLHPEGIKPGRGFAIAQALSPFLGKYATAAFLAGLWGAAISTITPTFLAAGYLAADKMGWPLSVKDRRFRIVVLIGILLSLFGPFLKGSFVTLLVIMLALGLVGTPLIIILFLILLNRDSVVGAAKNSLLVNIGGGLTLIVTSILAIRFIWSKLVG